MFWLRSVSSFQINGPGDIAALVVAIALWVLMWWSFFSKMGFRSWPRRLMVFCCVLPPVLSVILIVLAIIPWPVNRQLRQLRKQQEAL